MEEVNPLSTCIPGKSVSAIGRRGALPAANHPFSRGAICSTSGVIPVEWKRRAAHSGDGGAAASATVNYNVKPFVLIPFTSSVSASAGVREHSRISRALNSVSFALTAWVLRYFGFVPITVLVKYDDVTLRAAVVLSLPLPLPHLSSFSSVSLRIALAIASVRANLHSERIPLDFVRNYSPNLFSSCRVRIKYNMFARKIYTIYAFKKRDQVTKELIKIITILLLYTLR